MARRSPLVNVMAAAAEKAARNLRRDFGEVEHLQVSQKGPADFVSEADRRAEQILYTELKKGRPRFGFLMEERGEVEGEPGESRWIVDPLDGTTNFLHGLPHWAITIAVEERGEIVSGIVYDVLKDELFWADKGNGAFVNDQRLRVSGRSTLAQSLLATGIPFMGKPDHPAFLRQLAAFTPEVAGIRRFGSASLDLAYVAAGRYEGFWESDLQKWDIAAGILLVREAGGFVSDLKGGAQMLQNGTIIAANTHLHLPMLKILRGAGRSADRDD
ncbi:inositol monophosphatase [Iodidimonas nitroreducens]|uniref:Inositol-1-monophosphatase n=1 Tax=Iodidimonas nitroreducens TaxID=1236968 RepID=A0A5A7N7U7_9PROT|nr:inositol monophosphatase family protein [Iodidimonas nitroreducens]GAK33475.1 inositol-1-monophosphatase [alpha proteobacterium Q-1]GER04412.1 inositol monophosphatase [Iodidimonas nitroreducens]